VSDENQAKRPDAPDRPPLSNRVIAAVLVAIVLGTSALRLEYKHEIGRLPFDRVTVAIFVVAFLVFLFTFRRDK
jgi:hypothetical protein